MSDPQKALAGPRHYVYLPVWKDHMDGVGPTGRHNAQSLTFTAETVGQRQAFTFRMADGRNGEKLQGVLRLRIYDATPEDRVCLRPQWPGDSRRKVQGDTSSRRGDRRPA